jgi:hypothetical protein
MQPWMKQMQNSSEEKVQAASKSVNRWEFSRRHPELSESL